MRARWTRLFDPVDAASLALFRIAFGTLMVVEVIRYLGSGWIARYFVDPDFHFRYHGFQWVHPWPGDGMYLHFIVLGVLGLFIALGLFYRLSAVLFFLGFGYVFLLEQANYLNHFYMIVLLSFMMIFLPAHHHVSLDARRRRDLASNTVPRWSIEWLRFQVGIIYFMGGIAKINGDWLRGEPMREWLKSCFDWWLLGPYVHDEWLVYGFSYGGLLFDLSVVPMLLWRKTRGAALVLVLIFHVINATIFDIGIFPPLMAAATMIFLAPSWPRQFLATLLRKKETPSPPKLREESSKTPRSKWIGLALGLYVLVQIVLPVRHWLYPGNVSWTEEGHNFSWHMMLRDKRGSIVFYARNPHTNATKVINAQSHLSARQYRKMICRPDMVARFARHLAIRLQTEIPDAEIYVDTLISLNGRRYVPLIDPTVDLSKVTLGLMPKDWVLSLEEPLRRPSTDPNPKDSR